MKTLIAAVCLLPFMAMAQDIATYTPGQFAQLNATTERADSRLSVTVLNGSYALAWENIEQRWAVTGEEKLFILQFRVRNDGQRVESIEPRKLKLLVSDAANRSWDAPLAFRLPATIQPANAQLVQSQILDIETAFLVPASATIDAVYFADPRSDRGPGVRFDIKSAASLPRALSPDGVSIDPIVGAQTGTWYPLGVTDVRVDGFSLASEQIQNLAPSDNTDIAIVDFSVNNRSNKDVRISRGLYRETSVSTSDGDRDLLSLVFRNSDRSSDFPLLPGDTVALRGLFKIPKAADIRSVDFVEKIGTRGGSLSRRYLVALGSSGMPAAGSVAAGGSEGVGGYVPQTSLDTVARSNAAPAAGSASTAAQTGGSPPQIIGAERAPIPGVTGNNPANSIPAEAPDYMGEAEVPDGVIPEDVAILVRDDQTVLDPVPTLTLEQLEFPSVRYVAKMDKYYIGRAQESSGDEPWLAVIKFQGRQADNGNPPPLYLINKDRRFIDVVDWAKGNTSRSLSGNRVQIREFAPARPYETHAYIVLAFEGDNSSDGERSRVALHIRNRIGAVWQNYINRNPGFDYDDLSEPNRIRIMNTLKPSIETLYNEIYAAARAAARSFNWSSGDTDEFYSVGTRIWVHTDDGAPFASYGRKKGDQFSSPTGWEPSPATGDFRFHFYVRSGHMLPLELPRAPGTQWLDYAIMRDMQ